MFAAPRGHGDGTWTCEEEGRKLTEAVISPWEDRGVLARARALYDGLGERPGLRLGLLLALAALVGAAGGFFFAASPLIVIAALAGTIAALLLVNDPRLGLFAAALVITLLPFSVIPVALGGFQFTFLDLALTGTLVLWLARSLLAPDQDFHLSPVAPFIVLYLGITAVALVNGLGYGIVFDNLKLYLKSINAVLLFFTVLNCVRTVADARRLYAVLLTGGAIAGVTGIFLYYVPDDTAIALLSSLAPFGYPSGPGVLHFIADSSQQRATGTSIDPNAFGCLLLVVGTLAATQAIADEPIVRRRWAIVAIVPIAGALLLTMSRSSWGGLAGGILFAATVRYRRLWLLIIPLGIAALTGLIPGVDRYVEHLITGLRAGDKATLMRLGEYKDAIALISAYPWLGVGFGPSPRIDLYVGVSSLYFLLAEHTGLIGLGSYLLMNAVLFGHVLRRLRRATDARLAGLAVSALSAVAGALVAGIADHPFINIRFTHLIALFWLSAGLAVVAARLLEADAEAARDVEA